MNHEKIFGTISFVDICYKLLISRYQMILYRFLKKIDLFLTKDQLFPTKDRLFLTKVTDMIHKNVNYLFFKFASSYQVQITN